MRLSKGSAQFGSDWAIPALYACVSLAVGLTFPRAEGRMFPGLFAEVSVSAAMAFYSAIASGMITLTGIVFSFTFVMVQFSATAYSPRLVQWIARDPVISHALGMFTATFLYAIAALIQVDRGGTGKVPFVSGWIVVGLVLLSTGMFIALIRRISLLRVNSMLVFTGNKGREVIANSYPLLKPAVAAAALDAVAALPRTQTLVHRGQPYAVQALDLAALVKLSKTSGGIIEMAVAVGDTVVEMTPLLHVLGADTLLDERKLRNGIKLGLERTFEQDPKYAIRLLVDIAIKALSPAINDPTTAVQALDQIEDLLLRLGQRHLEVGAICDCDGKLRLLVPSPGWDDLLGLAFDEICFCGATSVQIMRRMNALIGDLMRSLPEERRPALRQWDARLKKLIARTFADNEERSDALKSDRQGLGAPRQDSSD
jgi:uncharacterized membrane protein